MSDSWCTDPLIGTERCMSMCQTLETKSWYASDLCDTTEKAMQKTTLSRDWRNINYLGPAGNVQLTATFSSHQRLQSGSSRVSSSGPYKQNDLMWDSKTWPTAPTPGTLRIVNNDVSSIFSSSARACQSPSFAVWNHFPTRNKIKNNINRERSGTTVLHRKPSAPEQALAGWS